MMMSDNSHMDMGMDIVHVVRNVHECIKVYQESPPISQCWSSSGTVWKSSLSSASRVAYFEDGCLKVSMWYCTGVVLSGDVISSVVASSSSSEELCQMSAHRSAV